MHFTAQALRIAPVFRTAGKIDRIAAENDIPALRFHMNARAVGAVQKIAVKPRRIHAVFPIVNRAVRRSKHGRARPAHEMYINNP